MFLRTTQSLECWDPTRSVVEVIGRKRGVGGEPETSDITWDVCSDTCGWWTEVTRKREEWSRLLFVANSWSWPDFCGGFHFRLTHSWSNARPFLPLLKTVTSPPQLYLLHCWLFQTRSADKLLKPFCNCLQNSFYKLHTETNKTCFKEPVK